ncbi:hydrolase [Kribbella hippodromi]|uniref:Hydrolase n=1 Tax=Kribbella hippodromi TaxID=434347 RepID=A0ABP4PXR1_9ACTN
MSLLPPELTPELTPERTALVLIDLQGANNSHPVAPYTADEVVQRSRQLIDAARQAGSLVVYVRTSFLPDESDSLTGKVAIDAHRPPKPNRPAGWDQLVDGIEPTATEPVIIKRSWNAFHGSDLDLQLRRHGIDTVVMAGISTTFGVEGTARAAYDHGYNLIFVPEAMSSVTAEQHDFSVREVFPQIGRVRDLDAVLAALTTEVAA